MMGSEQGKGNKKSLEVERGTEAGYREKIQGKWAGETFHDTKVNNITW